MISPSSKVNFAGHTSDREKLHVLRRYPYFTGASDQQPTGGKDDAVEIAFWNSVKDDKTPDAFQTYLASYPQGKFAALARLKLKQLTEPPKPTPSPPVTETPPSQSGSPAVAQPQPEPQEGD